MGDVQDCRRCGAPSKDGLCAACRALEETVTLRAPGSPTDLTGAFTSFRIEDELGRGGMGTVYRVHDLEAGEDRCLKVLRPSLALDEDFVGRLAQEAIAMAQLDHPGIVRFHRIGRERSFYYLLLEFVPGRDLGRLLDASGPLPVPDVLRHVLEACRALEFAHERGIIHRDIKPSNLLIDPSGAVRLSDFGLARLMDAGSRRRITDTGTILGTIRFSAPELFEDAKRAGPAADQYSLAATAYFALSGQFPFPGRTLRDVLERVDAAAGVPIAERRPEAPIELCRVLDRALERDPPRRFGSIAEFRRELERGSPR